MRLHYYYLQPNFGDSLNTWLWERLLPGRWDPDDGVLFSGIGTLIHRVMPRARRWIVFTSGAGYGPAPADFGGKGWEVVAVRGPLTAQVLRLPPRASVSDGALLLAGLEEFAPPESGSGVIFVPHHQAKPDGDWAEACLRAGVELVNPLDDSRRVIERIRGARLVLADAMHAAIVADAFRVPWVPLVSSPRISAFKWLDWTLSMEVPYEPLELPPVSAKAVLRRAVLRLADERHMFTPRDEPTALAAFEAQSVRSLRRGRRRLRRLGLSTMASCDSMMNRPLARRLFSASDERRVDAVATVLEQAARSPGFLSSERVFRDRLGALSERLETVRRITAEGSTAKRHEEAPTRSAVSR